MCLYIITIIKMSTNMIYTLQDINNIIFKGFDIVLPEETIKFISNLSLQVGSPTYIKTPVFQKREKNIEIPKKKSGKNNNHEIAEDWDTIRSFQSTKIDQKIGFDAQMDTIRSYLNKLSDKNYVLNRNKIVDEINNIDSDNMIKVSLCIFEIASTNRFYSKIYADLYSDLISNYEPMRKIFEESFDKFMDLFDVIEYVHPNDDYDGFCKNNKDNERRKSLSSFFVNLMINNIITKKQIIKIITNLLTQITCYITQENKKNQVDELTENLFILYSRDLVESIDDICLINGTPILEVIKTFTNSTSKSYPSLSNKSIFKFMDIGEK